jgi:predicted ArsR family transcriptional regulator
MIQPELDFSRLKYPDLPGAKTGGASQAAADSMIRSAGKLRRQVVETLRQFPLGMTADECAAYLGVSILAIRPRFSELVRDGQIVGTPERRLNGSGRAATVWRLVSADEKGNINPDA